MVVVHCVDVGSTFTKGVAVDLSDGTLLATASHVTTLPVGGVGDVMDGVRAVTAQLTGDAGAATNTLACSSAGGGLRLAVVGYERAVTVEAGYRVGLSAGARVVHVATGLLDPQTLRDLRKARPDVVLLVGGTDGGNADVLLHNAKRLSTVAVEVVVAGNAQVCDEAAELIGKRATACANVLPRIGVLDPGPARAAIRGVFLRHVIGGKHLSRGRQFATLVKGPTPDMVLRGVEALADAVGDVLVVDVGGATTDVYSAISPVGEEAVLRKDVVETLWRARTVEGDLGMRSNAPGVVAAGVAEKLVACHEHALLAAVADKLASDPSHVPGDAAGRSVDRRLATLAVTVALRRHARAPAPPSTSTGRDLRRVVVVVGSGGVLRHGDEAMRRVVLAPATADHAGGWRVPTSARVCVDVDYVLFAAGLLADDHPAVARALVTRGIVPL